MNKNTTGLKRIGIDQPPTIGARSKRALAILVIQALVLQPSAFAAWDISQQPLFTINPVHPNVTFMLDDSWSMNDYRLPPAPFFQQNFGNNPNRPRWPLAAQTIPVQYKAGTRNVLAQSEFTLRSSAHNPLAYDPGVTYTPWNDNDKPMAAQGTRPTRDQNFPNADFGGTGATVAVTSTRLTERDMRFRGFANASPNSPRNWATTARGTTGSTGAYEAGSLVGNQWTWHPTNLRWEEPVANPTGVAIYPPLPQEGDQAADLYTDPPTVCTSQPPCITWTPTFQTQCTQYQQVQTGTQQQCVQSQTVPTYGQQCVQTQQVQTGVTNGACLQNQSVQTGWANGVCLTWATVPVMQNQCQIVTIADATSETGFRQVQQCADVQIGTTQQCTSYQQVPVFQNQCVAYQQIPVFQPQCVQYQTVQTGTTQQCIQYQDVPTYGQQCVQTAQVQTGQTCTQYDPNWVCPQQNITSDPLTPARYYRYEGPVPASDDDIAENANYRMVEINRAVQNATFTVPVDARTGALRKRDDCAAQTSCTLVEEMQNYANWYTYYRHRLFAAIAVTSQAASDLKGDLSAIRLAYGRINYAPSGPDPWNPYGARLPALLPTLDGMAHPGAIVRGVRSFSDQAQNANRQQFFDWIFSLQWVGSTPNREAVDSVGRYYLDNTDLGPWADNPGVGGGRIGPSQLSCRRSFNLLATDGEWTRIQTPNPPPILPPPQPLIEARSSDPVGVGGGSVTSSLGVTGPTIAGAGIYQNTNYFYDPGVEVQFSTNSGGSNATLSDAALYWFNHDLRPDVPNTVRQRPNVNADSFWQSMTTYIVGYGLNATMNTPAVRAQIAAGQAVSWPNVDPSATITSGGNRVDDSFRAAMASRGDFYSATDPDAMRNSIRGVFKAIAAQAFSGTGLAATSSQLTSGSTLFRASFTTQLWTGKLEAFNALAAANAAANQQADPAPLWTASFPQWDQRNIYTKKGPASTDALKFDTFTSLSVAQQADLGTSDVMDYIRGKQAGLEFSSPIIVNNVPVTLGFRDRSTILGSIVTSSPLYSKAPNFGYQYNPAAGGGSSYPTHVGNNGANRRPAVYFGANAGIFHAIDGRSDVNAGGGRELFGYVPRSVYPYLRELADVEYVHRYFVDGPVVEGDVYIGGAWKTVVMGSTGAGPAGLFALDVTSPESFDATKVLWDLTPAEEPDLGKVMGSGFIGSVKYGVNGGKWVALVPNGYQSANNRGVLLVIDMETGQTLKKIDTCKKNDGTAFAVNEQGGRCNTNSQNGLSTLSVVFDGNRNVVGAYAGDYQGNLWKFDLSSDNPIDWKIATKDPLDQTGNTPIPLFSAVNNNVPQPITAAPRVSVHPNGGYYVVVATGKFFELADQTSNDVQTIYGLWDQAGDTAPISKASLRALGLTETTVNTVVQRNLTGLAGFTWQTERGWYFDLVVGNSPAGERVIADPVLDVGVVRLNSFQPSSSSDPCEGGGVSYFYTIPVGEFLNAQVGRRIYGVIGGVSLITLETAPLTQRRTTIGQGDVENLAQSPKYQRSGTGFTGNNNALDCRALFGDYQVRNQSIPQQCAGVYPLRTWRPVR